MLLETFLCETTDILLDVLGHPWVDPIIRVFLTLFELGDEFGLRPARRLRIVDLASDEGIRYSSRRKEVINSNQASGNKSQLLDRGQMDLLRACLWIAYASLDNVCFAMLFLNCVDLGCDLFDIEGLRF